MDKTENEGLVFVPGTQLQLGCSYRFSDFCKILHNKQFAGCFTIEVVEGDENFFKPTGKIVKYIRVIGIHL